MIRCSICVMALGTRLLLTTIGEIRRSKRLLIPVSRRRTIPKPQLYRHWPRGILRRLLTASQHNRHSLLEVYELDSTSRLLNISTRGFVGGNDNVMIAGLILNGTDDGTICFRALGPSLAGFGVHGVLADPRLDLFDAHGTRSELTTIGKTRRRTPSNRLDLRRRRSGIGAVDRSGAGKLHRDCLRSQWRNRRGAGGSLSSSLTSVGAISPVKNGGKMDAILDDGEV